MMTKENMKQPNSYQTQSRGSGPSGLDRVRQVAEGRPRIRVGKLLDHGSRGKRARRRQRHLQFASSLRARGATLAGVTREPYIERQRTGRRLRLPGREGGGE